jgi:DNA-binding CsgD family transcriptional regulator
MNTKIIDSIIPFDTNESGLTKLLKDFTDREIELLCRLTADPTNEEVANEMCVSSKSIANYKNRIGDKLGLKGHRALIKFVLRHCTFFKSVSNLFLNSAQRVEKQPTANSQQPTANSQQPTANSQQPTANSQQPTANSQQSNP